MAMNYLDPFGDVARRQMRARPDTAKAQLRNSGCYRHHQSEDEQHRSACAAYHAARVFDGLALDEHPHLQVIFRELVDGKMGVSVIDPTVPQVPHA
ncbi:MAG: hypothetical protein NXH74_05955 [Rhodobacteraceae bacterium]|nr:hypothetical protein [Paracoccaceae bacterium]